MKISKKKIISFLVIFILSFITFWALWSEVSGHTQELKKSINIISWGWIFASIISQLLVFVFETLSFYPYITGEKEKISFLKMFRVPLLGVLGNGITPFATGGQPMQFLGLTQAGISSSKSLSLSSMKFLIYQIVVIVFFLFSFLVFETFHFSLNSALLILVPFALIVHIVVIAGILLFMFWPYLTKKIVSVFINFVDRIVKIKDTNLFKEKINNIIDNFNEESVILLKNTKQGLYSSFFTTLQLFFANIIPYFIIRAFGYSNSGIVKVFVMSIIIIMIISIFPIPGGTGGAEISFHVLFSSFVDNSIDLVLIIIVWRLITYYMGLFLGAISYFIKPNKIKNN